MTEKIYCAFLDYLSSKEKQKLCVNLQKREVRVNGFRMIKDVPSKILALHISKNEKAFFKILQECYTQTFADQNEAIKAFSPDTAVLCLTYFLCKNSVDENLISSLLIKSDATSEKSKVAPTRNKALKKSEEFRQKYLSTYKELNKVKKSLETSQNENNELREILAGRENELIELETQLKKAQAKSEETVTLLKQRIENLESIENEQNHINELQANSILVLDKSEHQVIPGVPTVQFDNISQLADVIKDYSEVLFVMNDLPFHVKRYVNRIDNIQTKAHTFSTHAEMMEYIEKGRQK